MTGRILPVLLALSLTACLAPVSEAQCLRDSDCDSGVCMNSKCGPLSTGGGGGGGNGGGTGGGVGGGGGGGGATGGGGGGGPVGGGGGGTCAGCVDPTGQCRPGDSTLACGTAGGRCLTCTRGQQCVNGTCGMEACGPSSCAGCCYQNFCLTPTQQSRYACGSGGQACVQCSSAQVCLNGACTMGTCDVTTCPTGCCLNGQCLMSTSSAACGTAGQMCMRCRGGESCIGGVCLPGVTDGGGPVGAPVGSACTSVVECQPPLSAICLGPDVAGQPTGYVGGYCTADCTNGPCSAGVCVTETFVGIPTSLSLCRASCPVPGQQSTCRSGYVCVLSGEGPINAGYCRPRCDSGGMLASCPAGQSCSSGLCQ